MFGRIVGGLLIVTSAPGADLPSLAAPPPDVASWLKAYVSTRHTFTGDPLPVPEVSLFTRGVLGSQPGAVALFTLEGIRGGTDHLEYVAAFRERGNHFVFCCMKRVGGKGLASIESVSLADGFVNLSGMRFIPGKDAECCPSEPYSVALQTINGRLVEVRPSNQRLERP